MKVSALLTPFLFALFRALHGRALRRMPITSDELYAIVYPDGRQMWRGSHPKDREWGVRMKTLDVHLARLRKDIKPLRMRIERSERTVSLLAL